MSPRVAVVLAAGLLAVAPLTAQPPNPDVEVLARGPVHEAFATTVEFPQPGSVVPKLPPQPIEELPPDQRPEGENVQWIPGYWHWDEERSDFIWISGVWRAPPPGRIWVPGNWQETRGGYQWIQGFWQDPTPPQPNAPQAGIEYLPPPPQPVEFYPSAPQPTASSVYVPGTWVWRGRYLWRPGFWYEVRPGWVWVPAHYRWSPAGYVFVDGYWDHPLDTRGVLFAPVIIPRAVIVQRAFVYTPVYIIPPQPLVTSLFVRHGCGAYYFGDYFDQRYATAGFTAFVGRGGTNFAINITIGNRRPAPVYDPLWGYYQAAHRADPTWTRGVAEVYAGRYRGAIPRPPRTLVQQTQVVNNNTINNTVVNNVTNVTMVAPITKVDQITNNAIRLQSVAPAERVKEQQLAREMMLLSADRRKAEAELARKAPDPARPAPEPRRAAVRVPDAVLARAQTPMTRPTPGGKPAITPPPKPTADAKPTPAPPAPVSPSLKPHVPTKPDIGRPQPQRPQMPKPNPGLLTPTPPTPKVETPPAQPTVPGRPVRPDRPQRPTDPKVNPTPPAPAKPSQPPKIDTLPTPGMPVRPTQPQPLPAPGLPVQPMPSRPSRPEGTKPPTNPIPPTRPGIPSQPPPSIPGTRPTPNPLPSTRPGQPTSPTPGAGLPPGMPSKPGTSPPPLPRQPNPSAPTPRPQLPGPTVPPANPAPQPPKASPAVPQPSKPAEKDKKEPDKNDKKGQTRF